LNPSRSLDRAP